MRSLSGYDREWLWQELAHAVRQERPLSVVLQEISRVNDGDARGAVAGRLAAALARGQSLPEAIGGEAQSFGPGAAAAVEAGERGGNLANVLSSLADDAREARSFRSAIASVVAYPVVVALAALAAIAFIYISVFPMIWRLFAELDIQLPALTRHGPAIVQVEAFALLFLPALTLTLLYLVPPGCLPMRGTLDALRVCLPLVGGVVRRHLLARWCSMAGTLLRAGVAEPMALRLAGESCGNRSVERESENLSRCVERGQSLGECMSESRFFPEALTWMVRAAEEAGDHTHVWEVAGGLYRRQAQTEGRVMATLAGIVFALLAFQVVGVTVCAAFLPLIALMNSMGG